MTSPSFVITGGGTGGHLFPALAFAEALQRKGVPAESIRFIGAERGLEATVIPERGFSVDLLPGRGFPRRLDWENAKNAGTTLKATRLARKILKRQPPSLVVGFGGYASAPTIFAAKSMRIPMMIHEQNAVVGAVNRIAVRLGATAAVSWPETPLPGAIVVGNPVREDVLTARWNPQGKLHVSIVGGSLGAKTLNEAGLGLLALWNERDVVLKHACGPRNFDEVSKAAAALQADLPQGQLSYELRPFENDMAHMYATSHIVIGRAGASSVAELAVVGTPSVLVPLPGAPGDHQTRNARALSDHGGAILLADHDCTAQSVSDAVDRAADPESLKKMHLSAIQQARPDAADRLAQIALEKVNA